MRRGWLPILLVILATSGCANGFSKYYKGGTPEQIKALPGAITCETPVVAPLLSEDIAEVKRRLFEDGYAIIGYSHFTSGMGEESDDALKQVKKLGACLVLYDAVYARSSAGVVPITSPTTSTTTHSGSIYGAGAPIGYSGTSTTYGTTTTMMPYTVHVYEYIAVYAVRVASGSLGVLLEEVPEAIQRTLDSRQGTLVTAVRRDGPAHQANIFAGDILLTVNEEPVSGAPLPVRQGQKNVIRLLRDGRPMTKEVFIP